MDRATLAQLNYPQGVAVDTAGNIYISDANNNRVRKVAASTGIITTIVGGDGCVQVCNPAADILRPPAGRLIFPATKPPKPLRLRPSG